MGTLIKNVTELKNIIGGIQKDMSDKVWMPFIKQGEKGFIVREIGESFYDELCDLNPTTTVQTKLIEKLKDASGHYASMSSTISMVVSTGDIGILQNTTQNSTGLTKWQYVVKVKDARDKADKALEHALKYLQKNKASFDTYRSTDEYKFSQELLIPTADKLTDYLPIVDNSQMFYNRLTKYIFKQQRYWIQPAIGIELLGAFKEKALTASPEWTEEEGEALDLLCHALANKALAEAIPFLSINNDFRVVSETDGIVNEGDLTPDRKTGMQNTCLKEADKFLSNLLKYLNAKASDEIFPEFFNSNLYKPTVKPLDKLPPADEPGMALWL